MPFLSLSSVDRARKSRSSSASPASRRGSSPALASRTVNHALSFFNGLDSEIRGLGSVSGAEKGKKKRGGRMMSPIARSTTVESPRMRDARGRFLQASSPIRRAASPATYGRVASPTRGRKQPPLMMAEASAFDLAAENRRSRSRCRSASPAMSRAASPAAELEKSKKMKKKGRSMSRRDGGMRADSPMAVDVERRPRHRSPAPQAASPTTGDKKHRRSRSRSRMWAEAPAVVEVEVRPRRQLSPAPRAASPTTVDKKHRRSRMWAEAPADFSDVDVEVEKSRRSRSRRSSSRAKPKPKRMPSARGRSRSPLMSVALPPQPRRGMTAANVELEAKKKKKRKTPAARSMSKSSKTRRSSRRMAASPAAAAQQQQSTATTLLGSLFL